MWALLQNISFAVAGTVAGLGVGVLVFRLMSKSKRGGGIALAAALFFAMGHFTPKPNPTELPSDHTKIKRGAKPGDPPEPDHT